MKPGPFLVVVMILVLLVLGAGHFMARDIAADSATAPQDSTLSNVLAAPLSLVGQESAFDRVLRTNTIRCGYYVYPPATYRDANTGELSGFSVDMMNHIASKAGMKVEWTQEVTFGTWAQDLAAKRFDVACTPNWPTTALGRVVQFGEPMFFANIYAIGREGDKRFKTLADLNKASVKISIHEANEIYYLVKEVLPNATLVALPANAEGTAPMMDVLSGKADVMISDKNAPYQWNSQNKQKIAVAVDAPLKLQAFELAVAKGEHELLAFLNNAQQDMMATGALQQLVDKWMPAKGIYLIPAKPYED